MKPAISVHNISKQYRLGLAPSKDNNLTENLRLMARNAWDKVRRLATPKRAIRQEESFWALKDVSFDVMPGEVVGIIGRNGAGKSTLLKVLSHIVEPTAGYADIRGRMGSLLEVGTGFHPELTGRENIYLNGAILGMKREEINRKFDEIVAFAEVEKFLDTPVKRYSSGMYVRLAFSVAAHLEPEILIVDEVLAVGDQSFQKKCLGKMNEVRKLGRTVLFVSHNMASVKSLCSKCIYMRHGRIMQYSKTEEVVSEYVAEQISASSAKVDLQTHPNRLPGYSHCMSTVLITDSKNELSPSVSMKSGFSIHVDFSYSKNFIPVLGLVIKDHLSTPIMGINNMITGQGIFTTPLNCGRISCHYDSHPLMPGFYSIDLYLGNGIENYDVIYNAITFEILEEDVFGTGKLPPSIAGPVCWPARWTTSLQELTELK